LIRYLKLTNCCLFDSTRNREPDSVEIAALATVLYSFYDGVEKIFLSIAKYVDDFVPVENKWHKALLIQMTKKTDKRNAVITSETISVLTEYMGFRHFYRHAYSFQLSWSKLKDLFNRANAKLLTHCK